MPFPDVFAGFKPNYRRIVMATELFSRNLKSRMTKGKSSIRRSIRSPDGPTTAPVDFLRNRSRAMKSVTSSKLNTFHYNYGGYIPYDVEKKKAMDAIALGLDDYKKFLKPRRCDFISELIAGEDFDEETRQAEMIALQIKEEEEERKVDEARAKEVEKKKMLSYQRGTWNVQLLDYLSLEETEKSGGSRLPTLDESTEGAEVVGIDDPPSQGVEMEAKPVSLEVPEIKEPTDEEKYLGSFNLNEDEGSPAEDNLFTAPVSTTVDTTEKEKSEPSGSAEGQRTSSKESKDDLRSQQQQLEDIWLKLKMPLDQKLDMARLLTLRNPLTLIGNQVWSSSIQKN